MDKLSLGEKKEYESAWGNPLVEWPLALDGRDQWVGSFMVPVGDRAATPVLPEAMVVRSRGIRSGDKPGVAGPLQQQVVMDAVLVKVVKEGTARTPRYFYTDHAVLNKPALYPELLMVSTRPAPDG